MSNDFRIEEQQYLSLFWRNIEKLFCCEIIARILPFFLGEMFN